ncbi:hypothetical protein G9A89_001098 [Geosiphon pyriformis]|nr:hypothetical protein G9A89_001098 [Geosiphon pyriformis]
METKRPASGLTYIEDQKTELNGSSISNILNPKLTLTPLFSFSQHDIPGEIGKDEKIINVLTRRRSRKKQDHQNVNMWKPLLPRPPEAVLLSTKFPFTSPAESSSTPQTQLSPQEQPSRVCSANNRQTGLMPILLQAAAQAALRDKRQERKVKNRAAANESRKRKREASERLMAENKQLKARMNELENQIIDLKEEKAVILKENESMKKELEEKENGRIKFIGC